MDGGGNLGSAVCEMVVICVGVYGGVFLVVLVVVFFCGGYGGGVCVAVVVVLIMWS